MSKELIRLVDCTMAIDDEVVLDNITLNIHDKEFLTLLGPSGCGKTTTLRIIGGFQTPTAGDIFFDGVRINAVPAHKRAINTVFQRYALFPHLNVFENIAFGLRIPKAKEERDEKGKVIRRQKVKLTEKEIQERVMEMLDVVNLKGFEKRSVSSLSGGQQQRVAIARALVNRPKVLLLDEPLGALDMRLRKDMQNELKRIQQAMGITSILVWWGTRFKVIRLCCEEDEYASKIGISYSIYGVTGLVIGLINAGIIAAIANVAQGVQVMLIFLAVVIAVLGVASIFLIPDFKGEIDKNAKLFSLKEAVEAIKHPGVIWACVAYFCV